MVVPATSPHIDKRGDSTVKEQKYDATYKFGKSTVHVVAPPPMTEQEKEKVLDEFYTAGWAIIDRLEQLQASRPSKNRLSS